MQGEPSHKPACSQRNVDHCKCVAVNQDVSDEIVAVSQARLTPRLLFGVLLVSLQFLFYTNLRSAFGVSKADLTLVFDALSILRT